MNRWDGTETLAGLVSQMHLGGHAKHAANAYSSSEHARPNGWHYHAPPHMPLHHHGVELTDGGYAHGGGQAGYVAAHDGFHAAAVAAPQDHASYLAPQGADAAYTASATVQVVGPGMGINSMGWGGQAIPDAANFKAPWFGKNRGRNGSRGRGRTRGGNQPNAASRGRARRTAGNDTSSDDVTVESLVALVSAHPPAQPLSDRAYQALFQLEGRSCALLLKELARTGLAFRAAEIFDWVRVLEPGHPLRCLLDVYSYTAAISLCIADHDVDRAVELANEMKARQVERNVHTYTALMNVCIKCSKHAMALETFRMMRADGCTPNVVTYNTLIDVHGKMGAWEDAVAVLAAMKAEGVDPVLRTYNTLLIACNMCNQPREAVAVYRRMLEEGFAPNSTTFNALISAYGKAGQLDRVMEVFQEMMYRGCERSVITYSSLISACEKAGQWELALELFHEMIRERCPPNTVTFNSLITALGQGGQWEKAAEVFDSMHSRSCTPDVVTYTALVSALEKGGQWRLAEGAFQRMRHQGCRADAIVYNAVIDTLWETGVVWAQRRALALFRCAVEEGHFHQARLSPGLTRAEVNLHAMTAGVAMLSLYAWLVSLRQLVAGGGAAAVPARLAVVTDRGRGAKEQGNLVVKEAVAALLAAWGAPLRPSSDGPYPGTLDAGGADTAAWLLSDAFEAKLFTFFPCTDLTPFMLAAKGEEGAQARAAAVAAMLDDPTSHKEVAVEQRCSEAFAAVRHFEKTHCLALQNMGFAYLQRRGELVTRCLTASARLGVRDDAGHDAVLLMDRVMSTSLPLASDLLDLLAAACVAIAAKQVDGPAAAAAPPPASADLEGATGLPAAAVEQMEWNVRQVLGQDTAAISTLRCLKLYLERLGANHLDGETAAAMAGRSHAAVADSLLDMAFLNCRPSVIAASVLYADRRARGVIPFWPTMLAKLTGYQDMSTPELSVAIKAAQRMAARSATAAGEAAGWLACASSLHGTGRRAGSTSSASSGGRRASSGAASPGLPIDAGSPDRQTALLSLHQQPAALLRPTTATLTQLNLAGADAAGAMSSAKGPASGVTTPSQGVPHAMGAGSGSGSGSGSGDGSGDACSNSSSGSGSGSGSAEGLGLGMLATNPGVAAYPSHPQWA